MISSVADLYQVHPQTLRLYERQGLLKPSRSDGNTRLYTDDDLRKLEIILTLTRELGVNLAGVEVILHMREKMEQMQVQVEEMFEFVRDQAASARAASLQDDSLRNALVRAPVGKIVRVSR